MQVRPAVPSDGTEIADLLLRHAPHLEMKGHPHRQLPDGGVALAVVEDEHLVGVLDFRPR